MKALQSLALALALSASHAVTGTPVHSDQGTTTSLITSGDHSLADVELAQLEKRFNCLPIKKVVRTIGTSKFTVWAVTAGTTIAKEICDYAGYGSCAELESIIYKALMLAHAAAAHYAGAVPEVVNTKRDGNIDQNYVDWWASPLANSTFGYQSLDTVPFHAEEEALTRRSGDPKLLTRLAISGLISDDDAAPQDFVANLFEDGNTLLHIPITPNTNTSSTLGKRHYAGFKLSFTTNIKTKLTYAHQKEMANGGASYWAFQSDNYHFSDTIGVTATGHKANFYYRIIPETGGFGLNYESVDICGKMGNWVKSL